jgi:hypothetical protein
MAYPYDQGLDEEEKRRRRLIAQGLANGQDLSSIAGQVFDNRLQGFNDMMQNARAFLPGQQAAAPISEAQAVSPEEILNTPVITPPPTETPTIEPTQVAGPAMAQPAPSPTPQPQVAQPAAWQQRLNTLNMEDRTGLYAFAGDKAVPEDIRNLVGDVLARSHKKEIDNQTANDLLVRAAQGETKAVNTLMRDLRRPEGSYLKAILYNRLGLTDLARQEQEKLSTDDYKISQSMVDNKPYTVKTDAKGQVLAAWDNAGIRQGEDVMAKISAGGLKPGGQIYGFTGEAGTVKDPETGQPVLVRQKTNSQTGLPELVYAQGPKAGQTYTGSEVPTPVSLTSAMKKMDYGVVTGLAQKHKGNVLDAEAEYQKERGPFANEGERQAFRNAYGYFSQTGGAPTQAAPQAQAQPPRQGQAVPTLPPVAGQPAPPRQGQTAPTPAQPAGGITTPIAQMQSQRRVGERAATEGITTVEERKRAEQKPAAVATGNIEAEKIVNQQIADSTYSLIRPISDAIRQSTGSSVGTAVDKLAGVIGTSTKGGEAIAQLNVLGYQLVKNVPRFEGPQSNVDVQRYEKSAGQVADSTQPVKTRLAALDAVVQLMKKYDKAGRNDWSFSQSAQGQRSGKTQSGISWSIAQ